MPSFDELAQAVLDPNATVSAKYAKRGVTPEMMKALTAREIPQPRRVRRVSGPEVFKENLTDSMSAGLSSLIGKGLQKVLPGEPPLELRPERTTFNKAALETAPHMLGFMIGAPGQIVRSAGNTMIGRALFNPKTRAGARRLAAATASVEGATAQAGRKLPGAMLAAAEKYTRGVGGDLVKRASRATAKTAFTRAPLANLLKLKTAAEGAGGLAYGTAEGIFKGLRGEDLAAHAGQTGLMFSAFGAAELPIAVGFRVLARKWAVSASEAAAKIAQESIETNRHPADILREKVETNVRPSELRSELQAIVDPTGRVTYNVLPGLEGRGLPSTEVVRQKPPKPKTRKPRKTQTQTQKPAAEILSPQAAEETLPPKAKPKGRTKVSRPKRTETPTQGTSMPKEPIPVGLTSDETARLLANENLPGPEALTRTHLRKNLKTLSKETVESYRLAVENERTALVHAQRTAAKGEGLPSTEYNTRLFELQRELKQIKAAERSVLPVRRTSETPPKTVVSKAHRETPAASGPFVSGTPAANLRDVSGAPLERGKAYTIEYRTASGKRLQTSADGLEIMLGSARGTFRGDKILDITEIAPVVRGGVDLHGGLPIDPERLKNRVFGPATKIAQDFLKSRGLLTKEGEAALAGLSERADDTMLLLARMAETPQHFFRGDPKLAQFTIKAIDLEVRTNTHVGELLNKAYNPKFPNNIVGWDAIKSQVAKASPNKDAIKQLHSIMLEQDALAQHLRTTGGTYTEPTIKSLTAQGFDKHAAWGYVKTRQLLNTISRQMNMYEKAARPALRREYKAIMKKARKTTGEEKVALLADAEAVQVRLQRANLGYLEGYYPHMFFGGYRATINGESVPMVYRSEAEALRGARKLVGGKGKKADISVFPMVNDYATTNNKSFALDHPQYFAIKNRLEKAAGLTDKEFEDTLANTIRLRTRRRHFGHKVHRKGVEGFSRDVDEVMRIYIQRTQSYMQMDTLKREGTNIMERLTPDSEKRKAFTAYLRDLLREKQPGEKWLDAKLLRLFRTLPVRMLDDVLGITRNVPGLGALSRSGQTTLQSQFPSRRLVNGALSITAHLKLGLGNAGSAIVNLSQVPANVIPYLGEAYTARGYSEFLRANSTTRRMLDKAGINLIQPKYEAGLMLDRNTFERLSLGLFNKAETLNRAVTFLGKYHQLRDSGLSHGKAFSEARTFTLKTQFLYSPATNPELARNLFLRLPFQFRGYLIRELGLLHNMNYGAGATRNAVSRTIQKAIPTKGLKDTLVPSDRFLHYLAIQTAMSGALGLPAAFWLDHMYESVTGTSILEKIRLKYLQEGEQLMTFDSDGKPVPNENFSLKGGAITVGTKGALTLLGADFSQRIGMGDFIPVANQDLLMGATASTLQEATQVYDAQGKLAPAIASLGTTTKGLYQAAQGWDTGEIRNLRTDELKATGVSRPELVARALNIPTTSVTRQQEAEVVARGKVDRENKQYAPLLDKWAIAKRQGNSERASKLLKEILKVAKREDISADRVRQGLRSAMKKLRGTPTQKIFQQKPQSVRRTIGTKVFR